MKIKSLICLTMASMLSMPVFALEIYKGHLISSKVETTGKAKGGFTISKSSKNNANNLPTGSVAVVSYAEGAVGSTITIPSQNSVIIRNDTSFAQKYDYGFYICSQVSDPIPGGTTEHCINYINYIELEAGGYFRDWQDGKLQLTYSAPGNYMTTAATVVQKNSETRALSNIYSSSNSMVHVS